MKEHKCTCQQVFINHFSSTFTCLCYRERIKGYKWKPGRWTDRQSGGGNLHLFHLLTYFGEFNLWLDIVNGCFSLQHVQYVSEWASIISGCHDVCCSPNPHRGCKISYNDIQCNLLNISFLNFAILNTKRISLLYILLGCMKPICQLQLYTAK